jgi:betaine reductase
LKAFDQFDLIWLEESFAAEARAQLASHPLITSADLTPLDTVTTAEAIASRIADGSAIPLELADGRVVGCCNRAHDEDATLGADVLLENLCCVVTAIMATRTLIGQCAIDPARIPYVIGCGEEAIGDRYQRGGGNLAKAVAERCGLFDATGSDVKAFCCGPNHALAIAGGLVQAGVFEEIIVVGGCSLAKLGMKSIGHLAKDMPILEDLLASFAIHVAADDGRSPILRTDALGRHVVRAKSSQQAILECLVVDPLTRLGLKFGDVDRYATELHNPEVTEPAGSGNVPLTNYKMLAGLAVMRKEIGPTEMPAFIAKHGMPGFSPTQGHVASAIPYLGHALDGLTEGDLSRVLFMAKGSLFLGRMTQMADGLSFILERNPAAG